MKSRVGGGGWSAVGAIWPHAGAHRGHLERTWEALRPLRNTTTASLNTTRRALLRSPMGRWVSRAVRKRPPPPIREHNKPEWLHAPVIGGLRALRGPRGS